MKREKERAPAKKTPAPGKSPKPKEAGPRGPVKATILVVEDEPGLVLALEDGLDAEGYAVRSAGDGVTGQNEAASGAFDLVILDVMLPGRDGFQVCQNLRAAGVRTPVLMLTARSTSIDTVMGLRLGADDYLAKPFDMQVLVARVQALLRRAAGPSKEAGAPAGSTPGALVFSFGAFRLDTERMELTKGGEAIPLNVQEFRLLKAFARNPDRILNRDTLLTEAWGYDTETATRTVDVHVAWLRQKLGEQDRPRHLVTVRGYGYKLIVKP
jgi:two-component system alkaline phosphatase synthesis response regulator PhoP